MVRGKKNELVDVEKIRQLAESKYKSLEQFGRNVLNLEHRQLISERLNSKSRITADELFMIADDFGIKADDLRVKN